MTICQAQSTQTKYMFNEAAVIKTKNLTIEHNRNHESFVNPLEFQGNRLMFLSQHLLYMYIFVVVTKIRCSYENNGNVENEPAKLVLYSNFIIIC